MRFGKFIIGLGFTAIDGGKGAIQTDYKIARNGFTKRFSEHRHFEWQEGYGAFSVGIGDIERTVN